MMRRAILLLVATMAALVLASGVALAVTKVGTDGPDTLRDCLKKHRNEGIAYAPVHEKELPYQPYRC